MKIWTWSLVLALLLGACGGGSSGGDGGGSSESSSSSEGVSGIPVTHLSKTVQSGLDFTLVRDTNGTVFAFGTNQDGQLGIESEYNTVWQPIQVETLQAIDFMDTGTYHALAVDINGSVFVFGNNEKGGLGTGDVLFRSTPEMLSGLPKMTDVAAGAYFSLMLGEDGRVYGMGDNRYGQLGLGAEDKDDRMVPTRMVFDKNVSAIVAHSFKAILIDTDGYAYGLGYGGWGDFGGANSIGVPGKVDTLSNVVSASLGSSHALYLDASGNVFASGRSTQGQLGLPDVAAGEYDAINTPTKIPDLPVITMIAAGGNFSLVLDEEGNVWSFGEAGYLGMGDNVERRTPVKIPTLSNIVAIEATTYAAFALEANGTIYSWGYGGYGSLGHNGSANELSPKAIAGLKGVVQ